MVEFDGYRQVDHGDLLGEVGISLAIYNWRVCERNVKHQGRIMGGTYGIEVAWDNSTSNKLISHIKSKRQQCGIGKQGLWPVYKRVIELCRL